MTIPPGGDKAIGRAAHNWKATLKVLGVFFFVLAVVILAVVIPFRVLLLLLTPLLSSAQQQLSPALPLRSSSRWILDANNQRIKFRCVNWAGHQEANVPEGLDKQPIPTIVDWIKSQGFNCVRLTYSIDHALNPSLALSDSFVRAAAAANVPVQSTQRNLMRWLLARRIQREEERRGREGLRAWSME